LTVRKVRESGRPAPKREKKESLSSKLSVDAPAGGQLDYQVVASREKAPGRLPEACHVQVGRSSGSPGGGKLITAVPAARQYHHLSLSARQGEGQRKARMTVGFRAGLRHCDELSRRERDGTVPQS